MFSILIIVLVICLCIMFTGKAMVDMANLDMIEYSYKKIGKVFLFGGCILTLLDIFVLASW